MIPQLLHFLYILFFEKFKYVDKYILRKTLIRNKIWELWQTAIYYQFSVLSLDAAYKVMWVENFFNNKKRQVLA